MPTIAPKWITAAALTALIACSPSGGKPTAENENPGGGNHAGDDREVCPNCVAGGETGDFGGSTSSCGGMQKPLTAEIAQRFAVDDWRVRVEGPFDTSLRWVVDKIEAEDLGKRKGPYLALPSGYEEKTAIEGEITLGEPLYFEGTGGAGCDDQVVFPAQVGLASADGAIARIVTKGSFVISSSVLHPTPWLITQVALADVHGSLDLHIDPKATFGAPADGEPVGDNPSLEVFMHFFPDGVKSFVRPNIDLRIIIEGRWPDDGCGEASIAIDADTKQPWFGGATFAETYREWRAAIEGLAPTPGRWLDGSDVDVHVELGDAPARACLDDHVGFTYDSASRLVTSDGRVMAELTHGAIFEDILLLSSQDPTVSISGPEIDPGDFAARTGITGVDAAGSPYLSTFFEAAYTREAGVLSAHGALEVDGQPMCQAPNGQCAIDPQLGGAGVDCLQWPPDEFPEICGRHLH